MHIINLEIVSLRAGEICHFPCKNCKRVYVQQIGLNVLALLQKYDNRGGEEK
jgi:hypothetical protein